VPSVEVAESFSVPFIFSLVAALFLLREKNCPLSLLNRLIGCGKRH
jgi:hypothetical protein